MDSEPKFSTHPLASTAELLHRARTGDVRARDELARRYLPRLQRLAHGRLPQRARTLIETDDLVQETLLRAFSHLESFEPRGEGAFLAYLRRIVVNRVCDEARRIARRPTMDGLDEEIVDLGPSPIEETMGRERFRQYESALAELSEDQREAIVLRLEFGLTYDEIAQATGRVSAGAVRQFLGRAIVRLTERMGVREA